MCRVQIRPQLELLLPGLDRARTCSSVQPSGRLMMMRQVELELADRIIKRPH